MREFVHAFKAMVEADRGAVLFCLLTRTVWFVGERAWLRSAGNHEVAAAFAETEATDPDWRWDRIEASRKKPEAAKNSAVALMEVSELSPREWLARNGGKKWEPDASGLASNVRYPNRVIDEAREVMSTIRPAVDRALSLKDLPDGYTRLDLTPDVISTKIPHVDAARHASALLKWEIVLASESRDTARATAALRALLNTSRSIGEDPFLICQMVRISIRIGANRVLERVLAQNSLTDSELATLAVAWAGDAEEPLLLYGLRGERSVIDIMIGNLVDGKYIPNSTNGFADNPVSFSGFAWWLYRVKFLKDQAFYHRYLTCAVEIARRPIHEQPEAMKTLPPLPGDDLRLAQLFLPAVEKIAAAHWRSTAEARCVVVALACERFRLKNGRWPTTLSELPPDMLPSIPLDPFDGQPLRYVKVNDGIVIHATGRIPQPTTTGTVHVGLPEGIDIGFRLWNPEARRQPPPPDPKDANDP